jgi:hypothetical protein
MRLPLTSLTPPKSSGRFSYLMTPLRLWAFDKSVNERIPETSRLFPTKSRCAARHCGHGLGFRQYDPYRFPGAP